MNLTIVINDKNNLIAKIFGYYLLNSLNFAGSFLNFICALIFYKIIKQEQNNQGHLYKYLFIKSISDCLLFVVNMPVLFYFKNGQIIDKSFIMQVWFIFGYYYLYVVFSQISIWLEVFAFIDCLCLVSMKFQWHKSKLCFRIVTISVTLLFVIFYVPVFFQMKIEKKLNGGYYTMKTDLGNIAKYYNVLHVISRDLLPVCLSFIMNVIILWYIKKSTISRRRIGNLNQSGTTSSSNSLIARSIHAEKNKIKMIVFTSSLHVLHLPIIFYNLNIFNIGSNIALLQLCVVSINFYFSIPIVTYTAFNSTFRKYIVKMILFYKLFR
jgi:hypothetical protein